jgi:hypothetical protein
MVLGEGEGLKGCAKPRTGKPALALDPLALTQRLADMPFRTRLSAAGGVISTLRGRGVTFLTGRICDFSNGDRQAGAASAVLSARPR